MLGRELASVESRIAELEQENARLAASEEASRDELDGLRESEARGAVEREILKEALAISEKRAAYFEAQLSNVLRLTSAHAPLLFSRGDG